MYKYYKKIESKNTHILLSTVNNQGSEYPGKYSILSVVNDVITLENQIITKFNGLYSASGSKENGPKTIGYDKFKRYQTKILIAVGHNILRKACIKAGGNAVIGVSYHFIPIFDDNIKRNSKMNRAVLHPCELVITGTCVKIDGYNVGAYENLIPSAPRAPPGPPQSTPPPDDELPDYDDIGFDTEGKTDQ